MCVLASTPSRVTGAFEARRAASDAAFSLHRGRGRGRGLAYAAGPMDPVTADIHALSDEIVEAFAAHRPDLATIAGIPGRDDQWGDLSVEGAEAWGAKLADFERRARALSTPSDRFGRLASSVVLEWLDEQRDSVVSGDALSDLNSIESGFQNVRSAFDVMDTSTVEGWEAVAKRLGTLAAPLESWLSALEAGRGRGDVVARRQVLAVIEQARVASGADSFTHGLLGAYGASKFVSPAFATELEKAAGRARLAFADVADKLEHRYLPSARTSEPFGRARYLRAARKFLGETIDPKDTYAWGWSEVHAIEERMQKVAAGIQPGASLPEVTAMLDADPARQAGSAERFLDFVRERQARALEDLAGTHFDIPDRLRAIDVRLAPPGGSLGAYYVPPNEDFSRPGTIFYAPAPSSTFPLWSEVTTAYHEGFPGHHLQCGLQVHLAERLCRLHRLLVLYSGYAEGWALYAEALMDELGYFEKPEYALGMLSMKLMRALRVVVDIGLHLELEVPKGEEHGGERWNHAIAVDTMHRRAFLPRAFAESEVTRYLGWPGQAISYKVGERAILDLRDEARRRDGAAFDLRAFHDRVLGAGSVGLDRLRAIVRDEV